MDDTVIIGGAPFGFVNFPERLYNDYGVSDGYCILCKLSCLPLHGLANKSFLPRALGSRRREFMRRIYRARKAIQTVRNRSFETPHGGPL